MSSTASKKKQPSKVDVKRVVSLIAALVVFILPWVVEFPGLSEPGHRIFGIFLMAIVLWVTEAIPLHATAALIIFLQILLMSDRAMVPLPEGFEAPKYTVFYGALAHPVLMLFLGGFFLADGAAKYKLDRNLARILLKPFGTSPRFIMLGLMLITAVLSMFMSNTATTATMMAVVLPVIMGLPAGDKLRTGLALCIPIAANVGGIGTPVGTPPNAIALGALSKAGFNISFVQWMMMAMPFMLVTLFLAWLFLTARYRSESKELAFSITSKFNTSRPAIIFYFTFALTVGLWLTEPLHGVKSTIVGFVPVVLLLGTGVFTSKDLQSVQWHVLWLVAGGIALGVGVAQSGLDAWMIGGVQWESISPAIIAGTLCVVALAMSTVISNSAAANLLIPIGLSLATSSAVELDPVMAGAFIAIGASLAMALPISTPPNAIAYSTGMVSTKQMAITGFTVGFVGLSLFVFAAPPIWRALHLVP